MIRTIFFITIFLLGLTNIFGETEKSKLQISHLTSDFYVFTTYNTFNGHLFPANGMYLITNEGAVLFDTPWDTTQFQSLLDSIKLKHNINVVICIATHSHEDRTGGLFYYQQQGIKTYTTKQTDKICKERNEKQAEYLIEKDTVFTVGQYSFQTFYAGEGHSPDNIVIWFDKYKILYGGCLVKSIEANSLGNLADANVKDWTTTIKKIQTKFHKPNYIITGHQGWRSNKSLKHTLHLLRLYQKKVDM